jgi:GTP cyclohydrolase II
VVESVTVLLMSRSSEVLAPQGVNPAQRPCQAVGSENISYLRTKRERMGHLLSFADETP